MCQTGIVGVHRKETALNEPHLPTDLRVRGRLDERTQRVALRGVLGAAHLFGLATGVHLRTLRGTKDPLTELQARCQLAELQVRLLWELLEMLLARFAKVPEKNRPHFPPAHRFRILEIKNLLAWPADKAARMALVCTNTIQNWERHADPNTKTVGSLVTPTPPIRRAADSVRHIAQTMVRLGFGGHDMVARKLARVGWVVSARSVARYARERHRPAPTPAPPTTTTTKRPNPVKARFVNHTWMMDVSEVPLLLGGRLYVAAVFDAFSRLPLAVQVLDRRPTAAAMARLLKRAAGVFARPRYVITDRGGEFTGKVFVKAVRRLEAGHRLAAADNIHATAMLERFWRTLKDVARLRGISSPLTGHDLERRLETALDYYVFHRPHEGLRGATPAEIGRGGRPAHLDAVKPPRGHAGEAVPGPAFNVEHLDPEGTTLPILTRAA